MASLTADDEASSHVSLNPGSAPAAGAAEDGQRAAAPRPAPGAIRLQRPKLAADHVMHINPEFSEEVRRRGLGMLQCALGVERES